MSEYDNCGYTRKNGFSGAGLHTKVSVTRKTEAAVGLTDPGTPQRAGSSVYPIFEPLSVQEPFASSFLVSAQEAILVRPKIERR